MFRLGSPRAGRCLACHAGAAGGRCQPAAIESAFALAFQKCFERLIVFFGVVADGLKRS